MGNLFLEMCSFLYKLSGSHLPQGKVRGSSFRLFMHMPGRMERQGAPLSWLVGREKESGPDSDQVPSPATLRVKWQEEEEELQLDCGEVGWAGV